MKNAWKPVFILVIFLAVFVAEAFSAHGQVRGRVLDSAGNPVVEIFAELIPVEWVKRPNFHDVLVDATNKAGEFEFEEIRPGTYVLAVNYAWSPNLEGPYPTTFFPAASRKDEARPIEIVEGKLLENIVIRLPERLKELTIQGKVLASNGRPAVNVHVTLDNEEYSPTLPISDCRTDENGNFLLSGFVNGKYHVSASNYGLTEGVHDTAESKSFTLNRKMKGFRQRLKPFKLDDDQ